MRQLRKSTREQSRASTHIASDLRQIIFVKYHPSLTKNQKTCYLQDTLSSSMLLPLPITMNIAVEHMQNKLNWDSAVNMGAVLKTDFSEGAVAAKKRGPLSHRDSAVTDFFHSAVEYHKDAAVDTSSGAVALLEGR
jgi:hypothetical protein